MPIAVRLLLGLAGLLTLGAAAAAQPADFTPQQRAVYETYRLSLTVQTSSGYVARPVGASGSAYDISAYSTERWQGRRGRDRVSEAAFYDYAGAPEMAAAVRREKRGDWIHVGTAAGMLAGALVLSQVGNPEFTEDGRPNLALGGVLMLGIGSGIFWFRGFNGMTETKSHASAAAQAANRYNAILIEEIRRAGPNAGAGGR